MLHIENTIQTNGILLDDQWAEFLHHNHFLVGLSLDGPQKIHDAARVDNSGNGTFEKTMNITVRRSRQSGVARATCPD
jgi:uncharacterized protein